jgi:hypothetical protein
MVLFCHRCGGELAVGDGPSSFCQHCGAPQIYLADSAAQDSAEGSTGVLPPPPPQHVDWKVALTCAAAVSVVAAVLMVASTRLSGLLALSWLWTISASIIALGFYRKRRPKARMDAGVGARIGMAVGLMLILSVGIAMAGVGMIARFGTHAMGDFDAELHSQIEKAASKNPQPPEVMRYIYSPEFRAGMMLAGFAMTGGLIFVLSTVGGAVSGMTRHQPAT